MEVTKESQIPWMDEVTGMTYTRCMNMNCISFDPFTKFFCCQGHKYTFPSQSTSLPDVLEQSNQIGTVVIFVISALLTITLLFIVAIFIDCRHQKLTQIQTIPKKKVLKLKIPRMGRPIREDEATLANKMQQNEPSSSGMIV